MVPCAKHLPSTPVAPTENLCVRRYVGGNHGAADGHRLDQSARTALTQGGKAENISGGEERRDISSMAKESDIDAKPRCREAQFPRRFAVLPCHQHNQVRVFGRHEGEGSHEG